MKRMLIGAAALALTAGTAWADCTTEKMALGDESRQMVMIDYGPGALDIGITDEASLASPDILIEEDARPAVIEPSQSTFVTDPVILANSPDAVDRAAGLVIVEAEIVIEPDAAMGGMQTASWLYKTPRGHDLGLPDTGEHVLAMVDSATAWPSGAGGIMVAGEAAI